MSKLFCKLSESIGVMGLKGSFIIYIRGWL